MWMRRTSWIVGAAAVLLPGGFWVRQQRDFDAWASQQQVPACGTGIFAVLIMCLFVAAVLSLVATILGVFAYRRQPGPRTARRNAEILLISVPFILFAALAMQSPLLAHLF